MASRLLIILATASIAVSCAEDPLESAREYVSRGDGYARQGRYSAAVIEYRNAVRDAPSWRDAHEKLAESLVLVGRIEEAYREYTTASRIVNGQALPQSEDELRAAIERDPALTPARVALADLLLTRGEVEEAEQQLIAATSSEPSNELANRALAAIYVASGQTGPAEKYLRLATTAEPQRYRSQLALADFLMEQRRFADARAVLEQARADEHMAGAVRVRMAAIDYEDGAVDKAHRELEQLLQKEATAEAWTLQADLQFREGKLTEALASAREALALNPDFEAARILTEAIRREQLWPSS